MKWGISEEVPHRNLIKDIVIMAVCLALYFFLIVFMFTPLGAAFFDTAKGWFPFWELMQGTLSDINRIFGSLSEAFSMLQVPDIADEANGITLIVIFMDLSKMLLSILLQNLLFFLFTKLFLYGGQRLTLYNPVTGHEDSYFIADILSEGWFSPKKDILYYINHALLLGLSFLAGGFLGGTLLHLCSGWMNTFSISIQHWLAMLLFLLLLIVSVVYFMIKSRRFLGIAISFTRALTRVIAHDIVGELLTLLVTNVLVVFLFHSAVTYGLHAITFLALLLFLAWLIAVKMITTLLDKLHAKDLPYCGKYCPISGLLWLPSTISFVMLLYIATVTELGQNAPFYTIETLLGRLPLMFGWYAGASSVDTVLHEFPAFSTDLLNLLILCTVAALLQYLSSSYLATLFTQIVGRILFLLGLGLVLLTLTYMILYWACPPLLSAITYTNVFALIMLLLYLLFFILQPHVALQGILTTAGVIVMLDVLPMNLFWNTGDSYTDLTAFLTVALTCMAANLVFSLAQNLVAFMEKKFNLAKRAAETAVNTVAK